MDNPGWHAHRRAKKVCCTCSQNEFLIHTCFTQEDDLYTRHYRSGLPPAPSHDLAPIEESLIGGLKRSLFSHKPPAVPSKDTRLPSSKATYTPAQLVKMSAVDRSNALRAARMDPHLQVRAMLSYLTSLSAVHSHLLSSCAVRCSSMHVLYFFEL